jgi:hypothetical protein
MGKEAISLARRLQSDFLERICSRVVFDANNVTNKTLMKAIHMTNWFRALAYSVSTLLGELQA